MSMLSERLQDAINMRGVTQRWVADKANTTEATISRYVKAKNDPAIIEILGGVAQALNVSSDFLIGITNVPDAIKSVPVDQQILLSCFSKISDADAMVLWALLDKYMNAQDREKLASLNRQEAEKIG